MLVHIRITERNSRANVNFTKKAGIVSISKWRFFLWSSRETKPSKRWKALESLELIRLYKWARRYAKIKCFYWNPFFVVVVVVKETVLCNYGACIHNMNNLQYYFNGNHMKTYSKFRKYLLTLFPTIITKIRVY